jgi:hypothetical protein
MRLILKYTFLSLTLFIFSFILSGCVEEPTIAPAYRLNSVIRVVNVSNNQNNIKVILNGETPVQALSSIAIGSSTDFFDYPAGKKRMQVADEGGNIFFTKEVEVTSLELITIVLAGHYDPDPLVSTFTSFELAEGETYVSHAPAQGTSNLYFVHASAAVDTFNTQKYRVLANFIPADTVVAKDTAYNPEPRPLLEFSRMIGAPARPGTYTFRVTPENGSAVVFNSFLIRENGATAQGSAPLQMEANYRYYMFIYGNPNNVQLFVDKVVPPAIRPRD